jgi:hypothetical protein
MSEESAEWVHVPEDPYLYLRKNWRMQMLGENWG